MLHSEKARLNHERANSLVYGMQRRQFECGSASQLLATGAPLAHVEHMITKGHVINDL